MQIKKEPPISPRSILMLLLVLAGLYVCSLHSFLLFHSLVELFSISVAGGIFMLAWNARAIMRNNYFLFLGISYFFVGILGLFHILTYKGMGIFQGDEANMATQFWIGTRYLEGFSLLASPIFFTRKLRPVWTIVFFSLLTSVVIWMIFSGFFPICYETGRGLTTFKKVSEYLISLILLGSLFMLYTRRRLIDANLLMLIAVAILFAVIAEVSFTSYVSVYGKMNVFGHLFRFISFYLIYKAIIETGLKKPYELLFADLKKNEAAIRNSEQEFRAMFELSAVGMAQSDPVTDHFVRVNDRLCRITGYSADELLTMSSADLTCPEDLAREGMQCSAGNTWKKEMRYSRKDGVIIWVKITGTAIGAQGDQPQRNMAIIEDITERKTAEQTLRDNEKKYRLLFENMLNGFAYHRIIVDEQNVPLDYIFLEVNSAFERKTGLVREQIIGRRVTEALPHIREDDFDWIGVFGKVALTGEAVYFDQYIPKLNKWFSFAAYSPEQGFFAVVIRDITLSKQAEQKLRRSEWRFKGTFENAAVGFAQVSLEGRWLDANSKLCDILGYSREELLQKTLREITHPEDLEEDNAQASRLACGRIDHYSMEKRYLHKDGHIIWTNLTCSMQLDDEGNPLYFINVVEDIGWRKRVEQALKESEEKFRLLADSIKDVIWMSSPGVEKMIYINPAYEAIWGRTCESLYISPASFAEAIHPDDMELMADAFQQHAAGKWHFNYRIVRPDGTVRWIEDAGSPIYDEKGDIVRMVGVARDVTERKQAEQAREKYLLRLNGLLGISASVLSARSTQDMLQKVIDAAVELTDAIYGTSGHGFREGSFQIGATSRSAEASPCPPGNLFVVEKGGVYQELIDANRSLRLTDEQLRKHPRWQGLPAGHAPLDGLLGVSLTGRDDKARGMIMVTCKKEGEFSLEDEILLRQLASLASLGLQHIEAREQAEQKALEADLGRKRLIELTGELERSNKDLQQFAYIASHDLQEPLRTVAGFVQLLSKRYRGKLDEKADSFIDFAVDGTTYMQKLLNDLLAYSRVGGGELQLQPLALKTCVERAVMNLKKSIDDNGATIECDTMPTVFADEMQMVQLLQNLIGNAVKFRGQEPPHIQISAEATGHEWLIRIRDNGIGIDPQHHDRIFLMFKRLHRRGEYPGTGIGLALCKKIVERHGGRMWVEPAPEKGTAFYISLPAGSGERS
ncbi:MAG: PAS domain S-box protein [Deltaproteobacteria bacterium]|nr:PAS domain S-box protein [Deltaproteobacteria bacterium]